MKGADEEDFGVTIELKEALDAAGVVAADFVRGIRLELVVLVQAEEEVGGIVALGDGGEEFLWLLVGVFFHALNPDGEKHVAEHAAGELHVLDIAAVDVRQIKQDLAAEVRQVVRDDAEAAGGFALEQIRDRFGLVGVRVGDGDLGAAAEAGGRAELPAGEGVDQCGLADFLAADQTDKIKRRVLVDAEDGRIGCEEIGPGGAGELRDFIDELFEHRVHTPPLEDEDSGSLLGR